MFDGNGIVVSRHFERGKNLFPKPRVVPVAEGAERPGTPLHLGEGLRVENAVFADIVFDELGILGVEIIDRAGVPEIPDDFRNVHALPEEMGGIYIRADHLPRRFAQAQKGCGVIHAEPGMQFEGDFFHAVVRRKLHGFFPIGNEHFLPLPFQRLGIIGRPGTGDPGRRFRVLVRSRAPRERNQSVHADLPRQDAGGLKIRLELFRRRLVGMHAVPVHRQGGNAHIILFESLQKRFPRLFVLAQNERVRMRFSGIAAHAELELVHAQTRKIL